MLIEIKKGYDCWEKAINERTEGFLLVVIFLPLSFGAWEQPLRRALEHSSNTYYMAEREKGY